MVSIAQETSLIKAFFPALLWAGIILVLIGLPGYALPSIPLLNLLNFDKFVHLSIFLVQALLFLRGAKRQTNYQELKKHAGFWCLIFGIAYAGTTEVLQSLLFIQRSADVGDFIANSIGIFIGLPIANKLKLA
jgi:glycopeptide antibiotics resistance protein